MAEALLAGGAAVDVKTNKGSTPLHIAAQNRHSAVAKALLARGARGVSAGELVLDRSDFAELDRDRDGKASSDELDAFAPHLAQATLDQNQGVETGVAYLEAVWREKLRIVQAQADTDADAALSFEELKAAGFAEEDEVETALQGPGKAGSVTTGKAEL